MSTPALLLILGASGVGKTAAVDALAKRRLSGVCCYHFDSIGVPSEEELARRYRSGEQWQAVETHNWIARLAANSEEAEICVLEGQTRPSFVQPALRACEVSIAEMVLLGCTPEVRAQRLTGPRGQPELVTTRMDCWAAYLHGQADLLGLKIIDTSQLPVSSVVDELTRSVETLRERRAARHYA
jgi:hypothetical protein